MHGLSISQLPSCRPPARAGFTLVELSIVLVIIGLLIGGVMVGQSMIRASELNAVLREVSQYAAAANTFKSKYDYLPGDFPNATTIWGKDNANCSTAPGIAATPGTCNGDGNSQIPVGWSGANTDWGEMYRFWQQLNLAGLLPGRYTGLPASSGMFKAGENVPVSRFRSGTYALWHADPLSGNTLLFDGYYGNFLILGAASSGHPWASLMMPEQAYLLDMKEDDGRPGLGKIVSNTNLNAEGSTGCATGDNTTAKSAAYLQSNTSVACILMFRKLFQ